MACMKCGGTMKKGGAAKVKKLKTMQKGGGIQKIVGMPGYNANTTTMQKGGIFTPNGRLKSKKTRNVDTGFNPNSSVSRTKRNGDVVTKSINTSQGFVPSASKTKSITDKEGTVKSEKTKSIGWNNALRKINRVDKNAGRNENDTYTYQKGGATKKSLTKAQNGMVMPGRILKKMNPANLKYKDMDPGFTKTPKGPYKDMDPGFTKTPNKPYKNMDPGFSITPKINPGNKDVFKNAGPPPKPKGYKQMGGLIKRKK